LPGRRVGHQPSYCTDRHHGSSSLVDKFATSGSNPPPAPNPAALQNLPGIEDSGDDLELAVAAPDVATVPPRRRLADIADLDRPLGFRLEPFGGDAVRLLAAPLAVTDPEGAFLGAVEALAGGEDLAKALACRGSTKFGEELSREALDALLEAWAACEFGHTCTQS
jgi:hypothetical protein